MQYIKIVSNLVLDPKKGLLSKDKDGRRVYAHYMQGDMDGACAVYCLMMNLLILGYISGDDISVCNKINKKTTHGKFLSHFLEEQGLIRAGYKFRALASEIRKYCVGLNANQKIPHSLKDAVQLVYDTINNDRPIIISVEYDDFRQMGHALLAVGVELNDKNEVTKILCLDPGASSPFYTQWNCYIDVSNNRNSDYPYWYVTGETSDKVTLKDMVLITLKG